MKVMPVLVAFYSEKWIRNAVESFHKIYPDEPLLIVDNNPRLPELGAEKRYLKSLHWATVVSPPTRITHEVGSLVYNHGQAIDFAVDWCRRNNWDVMLHFEPDCLIKGKQWYNNLLGAIEDGAWMSGGKKWLYGPIHPTPSMWRLDKIMHSFNNVPKDDDFHHPMHHKLVDLDELRNPQSSDYIKINAGGYVTDWDTGLKNWFYCAIEGKDAHVRTPDFIHFCSGSHNSEELVRLKIESRGLSWEPRFIESRRYPIY